MRKCQKGTINASFLPALDLFLTLSLGCYFRDRAVQTNREKWGNIKVFILRNVFFVYGGLGKLISLNIMINKRLITFRHEIV